MTDENELDDDQIEEEWLSVQEARRIPAYNFPDAPAVECLHEKAAGLALLSLVVAPLDRAKLILQTQNDLVQRAVIPRSFSTGFGCMKYIINNQSFSSLWRGTSILIAGRVLQPVVTDITVEQIEFRSKVVIQYSKFVGHHPGYSLVLLLLAGLIPPFIIGHPLQYARTRIAADFPTKSVDGRMVYQFKNIRDVFRKTLYSNSFFGLYRGGLLGIAYNTGYASLYFGLHKIVALVSKPRKERDLHMSFPVTYSLHFIISFLLYPLDSLKCRLMMNTCGHTYMPIWALGRRLFYREGLFSLYRGFLLTALQLIPLSYFLSEFKRRQQKSYEYKSTNAIKPVGTARPPSEYDDEIQSDEIQAPK